jgi:hypothetical protein
MTFAFARPFRATLRTGLCMLFGLLSLAACSRGGAVETGPAPGGEVLQRAEFEGNGRDVYQTIAVLRPRWLNAALDSTGRLDPSLVAVFVGGQYVGDLTTLRSMSSAEVGFVQLQPAQYVRRTSPELAGSPVNAGLYVSRFTGARQAGEGRMGYSFQAGALLAGTTANHAYDALSAAGYDYERTGRYELSERGKPVATAQVGAWYALRGPLRAEAHVERSWRGKVLATSTDRSVEGRIASTDVDLMLSVPLPSPVLSVRLGAGPAVRIMDASWTGSSNPIELPPSWEGHMSVGYGVAAALTASTPLDDRFTLMLEAKGRYFGGQDLGEYRDRFSDLEMEGAGIGVSLGLGFVP